MKNIFLATLLIFFHIRLYSQEVKPSPYNLNIEVSFEQRITPIYLDKMKNGFVSENKIPLFYDQNAQISGTGLNFGLCYYSTRINSALRFIQTFRYDHVFFDTELTIPNAISANKSVNDLITDYHFVFEKKINYKGDYSFGFGIGYSLMNRGTDFSYTRQTLTSEEQQIFSNISSNFSFSAFNIYTSIEKQNVFLTLGSYIANKHQYDQSGGLMLLYLKMGYNFKIL